MPDRVSASESSRSSIGPQRLGVDDRGVTPAVGKSLEVGLVVLFVGLLTTVLLGGVVPDYRRGVDAGLADRVLATASQEVETAVPPAARSIDANYGVDLPSQIGGEGYVVRADGRSLVLEHPDAAVAGRVRLVLSDRVVRVDGRWQSGGDPTVHVYDDAGGLVVELIDGGGP